MNITLLSKAVSTAMNKSNKPYQIMEVAYKNNTFQGKVEGKKITSYTQPAYDTLAEANAGDTFEVVVEKKNGFNEWVKLDKAAVAASQPAVTENAGAKEKATGQPAIRSTYETSEERARRQVLIVRQSSLSSAISTLSVGSKNVSSSDVIKLATEYSNWVFGNGFEDMTNDNPDDPSVGAPTIV